MSDKRDKNAWQKGDNMQISGESLILAPRDAVWAAINDPDMLARCIDGVESLNRVADDRFEGRMNAKVGPVRATFAGSVTLSEIDAPNRYVLSGEGKGGVAGFAKGRAEVRLTDATAEDGRPATLLSYDATSQVGGKLAQLGARLIEGAAKGYAENFFATLKAEIEQPAATGATDVPVPDDESEAAENAPSGLPPLIWGALITLITIFLLTYLLIK